MPGCDMERCPFCGGQLISCGCDYEHFYPETYVHWSRDSEVPFSGLPEDVYENGLRPEQEAEWEKLLEAGGRIPYIRYPNLCAYCGALWPEMFSVPTADWERYIEPAMRREMLCILCYLRIVKMIDDASNERKAHEKASEATSEE